MRLARLRRFWRGGGRRGLGGGRRGRRRWRRRLTFPAGGRLGLDEFDHRVGVAEFGELGGEQRVIARVVHEAEVILKFRVKADDENIFFKRHRMGVHQIAARERADPADGVDQLRPQFRQIAGTATGAALPPARRGAGGGFRCWRPVLAAATARAKSRRGRGVRLAGLARRAQRAGAALPAQLVQLFQHGVQRQRVARLDGAEQR